MSIKPETEIIECECKGTGFRMKYSDLYEGGKKVPCWDCDGSGKFIVWKPIKIGCDNE